MKVCEYPFTHEGMTFEEFEEEKNTFSAITKSIETGPTFHCGNRERRTNQNERLLASIAPAVLC